MSRRRYISSDISTDVKLAELAEYGLLPLLLYTWAIPHADDWGRMTGDARQFKLLVCPALDVNVAEIEDALNQIAMVGLWRRYQVDGKWYIAFPEANWFKHQTYINKSKRNNDAGSQFPAPPNYSQQQPTPQNAADQRKTPQKAASPSPSPTPSPSPSPSQKQLCAPPTPEAPALSEQAELGDLGGAGDVPKHKHQPAVVKPEYPEDFEHFWAIYPRHKEKRRAFKAWKTRLKEGASADDLIAAASNYALEVNAKGTDPQFIKHAATFLGPNRPFEDYIRGSPEPVENANRRIPRAFRSLQAIATEEVFDSDESRSRAVGGNSGS